MNSILDRIFNSIIQDVNKLDWNISDIHAIRKALEMYLNTLQKYLNTVKYMLRIAPTYSV